jgi:hypothetical protein
MQRRHRLIWRPASIVCQSFRAVQRRRKALCHLMAGLRELEWRTRASAARRRNAVWRRSGRAREAHATKQAAPVHPRPLLRDVTAYPAVILIRTSVISAGVGPYAQTSRTGRSGRPHGQVVRHERSAVEGSRLLELGQRMKYRLPVQPVVSIATRLTPLREVIPPSQATPLERREPTRLPHLQLAVGRRRGTCTAIVTCRLCTLKPATTRYQRQRIVRRITKACHPRSPRNIGTADKRAAPRGVSPGADSIVALQHGLERANLHRRQRGDTAPSFNHPRARHRGIIVFNEVPGGGDDWLPSPSPSGPAFPSHDEHRWNFVWPPVGTSTRPPVRTIHGHGQL